MLEASTHMDKHNFTGKVISIQPRIRLSRSFDEASYTYLVYAITLGGGINDQNTTFSIGISKAAHAKHQYKMNGVISGACMPVPNPEFEPTQYYKVSKLKLITGGTTLISQNPGN